MKLEDFPERSFDKLRYGDTDRQGHVNNACFMTFLETGRTGLLHAKDNKKADEGCSFVVASVTIDFRAEMHWPGNVDIGSRVVKIGNSSVTFEQALFQDGKLTATSHSVLVQMNDETRKPQPLSEAAKARFGISVAG